MKIHTNPYYGCKTDRQKGEVELNIRAACSSGHETVFQKTIHENFELRRIIISAILFRGRKICFISHLKINPNTQFR